MLTNSNNNYTKNYLNVYFWRIFSVLTGILSLLIVIPQLSLNKELYGIYTFCLSFNLYFTYADIGFLSAGQKYAAEEYAKGNRESEINNLGFTGFILLCMVIPFSLTMLYLSFRPEYVINELSEQNRKIVSKMFLIMGVISPLQIILQRLSQSILIIRIKDYVSLRIDVIFNIIKIFSVYYFFNGSRYLVVEYFLFINILTLVSSLIIIYYIRSSENYNFRNLLFAIKFNRQVYERIKKLAFASMFMTISWILYYEIDLLFIGKLFGPKEVAVYSISFSVLNFLRNLWNIIYAPFSQRFNHYVGQNSFYKLRVLTFKLINYTFPISLLSVVILLLSSKYLIISWVGINYTDSIIIFQILLLCTLFNFIVQPASYYFISITNYWYLNLNTILLPSVFLISLYFFVPIFGIKGFAIAKVLAITTSAIISFFGIRKVVNLYRILKEWILSIFLNSLFLIFWLNYIYNLTFSSIEKGKTYLLMLIGLLLITVIIVLFSSIFLNKSLRQNFIIKYNNTFLKNY